MRKARKDKEMEFKIFAEKITERLSGELGQKIEATDVTKTNGTVLKGIHAVKQGVSPVLYIEKYYYDFEKGKPFDDVYAALKEEWMGIDRSGLEIDTEELLDGDHVRNNLVVKLINYELNKNMLKTVVHRRIDDFAIVPIMDIDLGTSIGEIKFTKKQFETYGWNEDEIIDEAMKRSEEILPPLIDFLSHRVLTSDDDNLLEEEIDEPITEPIVITNKKLEEGAVALYYPEVMEWLKKNIEGNFCVIPSSIHEVIVLPDVPLAGGGYFTAMLKGVNDELVSEMEVLGTKALIYDRENDCFVH